jgi:hypothetical protein
MSKKLMETKDSFKLFHQDFEEFAEIKQNKEEGNKIENQPAQIN